MTTCAINLSLKRLNYEIVMSWNEYVFCKIIPYVLCSYKYVNVIRVLCTSMENYREHQSTTNIACGYEGAKPYASWITNHARMNRILVCTITSNFLLTTLLSIQKPTTLIRQNWQSWTYEKTWWNNFQCFLYNISKSRESQYWRF